MINLNDQKQAFSSIHQDRHTNVGPAFPIPLHPGQTYTAHALCDGMTLREYTAIKLRVPDSGTDWIDEMIRKSARNELAARAMQGIFADLAGTALGSDPKFVAEHAYAAADAMLRARGEA